MGKMYDKALKWLRGQADKRGGAAKLLDKAGANRSTFYKVLSGAHQTNAESFLDWLENLGARIEFPDQAQDTVREVCFVAPRQTGVEGDRAGRPPAKEDYLAVPLAAGAVAAGPGLIPEDRVGGWVLVYRHHASVRFRTDLVAVEIGANEHSMEPTLVPGDIVLVDKADKSPDPPGKIMLVNEPGPDGGAMVKRVCAKRLDGDTELVFYSENSREFPPMTYRLNRDYDGDIGRAVAGHVVWAWSDMTRK